MEHKAAFKRRHIYAMDVGEIINAVSKREVRVIGVA
jgi:hypothetical protein